MTSPGATDLQPNVGSSPEDNKPWFILLNMFLESDLGRFLPRKWREARILFEKEPVLGICCCAVLAFLALPVCFFLAFIVGAILVGVTGFLCFEGLVLGAATFVFLACVVIILLGGIGFVLSVFFVCGLLGLALEMVQSMANYFFFQTKPPSDARTNRNTGAHHLD